MPRLIVILLALAALGGLAGCGSSDSFNPDVVAQAADKTASAGGAKLAIRIEAAGQKINGTGFMDTKGHKGRMSLQIPQLRGTMDAVFLNRIIYLHFPAAIAGKIPGGKSWVKLDLDKAARQQGIDLGALQSTSTNNDPAQQLAQLRGAGDVKKVGTETIRGTKTTHYKATIDLRKAADRAPADQRAAAKRSVEQIIKLTGSSTVPTEVWLDKQGRARRMSFTMKAQGQSLRETMDLYDFGTREAIKAPPASDTQDITELAGKAAAKG
jgi:hypothetical protein